MKESANSLENLASHIVVEDVLGLPKEEILARKHNLWIAVSLGNPWFSEEHLRSLIAWSVTHTKDSTLVVIPGRFHATNYRYIERMSRANALQKAYQDEALMRKKVAAVLQSNGLERDGKVVLCSDDDLFVPSYVKRRAILFKVFADQGEFYKQVLDVTRDALLKRGRTVDQDRLEALALYSIHELPLFIGGVRLIGSDSYYSTVVYPGIGKIDDLAMDIRRGTSFPELTRALDLRDPVGIVSIRYNERYK